MPVINSYQGCEQAKIYTDRNKTAISLSDIIILEGVSNYTFVHFVNGKKILISKTLKEFSDTFLANNFARIHKSYFINMNYVMSYQTKGLYFVTMKTGQKVEISRRRKQYFERQVAEFIRKRN